MTNLFVNRTYLNSSEIKQTLNEIITPELKDYGFDFNGDYLWFTNTNNGIRKIVKYQRLKGETGILEWGVCMDFVPTVSGSSIKWNRTEKTMTLHLFDWPKDYGEVFFGGKHYSRASHWGQNEFKRTLKKHFELNKAHLLDWLSQANDIDELTRIAEYQINTAKEYTIHHPSPKYVLMFLYAKADLTDKVMEILNDLNLSLMIKEKISKLIKK